MDQKTIEVIVQEVIRRLSLASPMPQVSSVLQKPHVASSTLHASSTLQKPLIVEADILQAVASGAKNLRISPKTIVTPLAIDTARTKGITLERVNNPSPSSDTVRTTAPSEIIAIGSDHEGHAIKEVIKTFLTGEGQSVRDFGSVSSAQKGNSRDIAYRLAHEIAAGHCGWGIIIDGMGVLPSIVANKVSGSIAVTCHDCFTATMARSRFGANVLCLGWGIIGQQLAVEIVRAWMTTQPVCQPGSYLPSLPDSKTVHSDQPSECQILVDDLDCL